MMIEEKTDKVKFNCNYCGSTLKIGSLALNKNIKCPKCSNIIVPKECIGGQNPKPIETITNIKKSKKYKFISSITLLTFLSFAFIVCVLFFYKQSAKIDKSLLEPRITYR